MAGDDHGPGTSISSAVVGRHQTYHYRRIGRFPVRRRRVLPLHHLPNRLPLPSLSQLSAQLPLQSFELVEPVAEEVGEDLAREAVGGAPLVLDVRAERGVLDQARDLRERIADREQNAVHLRVLVCARAVSSRAA